MAELSNAGLLINSFDSIMAKLIQSTVDVFSSNVPMGDEVDTSASSVLGRLLTLVAPYCLEAESCLLDIYNSMGIDTASNEQLDRLIRLVDHTMERLPANPAKPSLHVCVAPSVTVPAGSVVGSVDNESYFILDTDAGPSSSIVGVEFTTETNGEADTKSITFVFPTETVTFSVAVDGSKTRQEELADLKDAIVHPLLETSYNGSLLRVMSSSTFTYSQTNLSIRGEVRRVQATAKNVGSLAQKEGDISVIQTPVLGWSWVSNPSPVAASSGIETDEEFRARFSRQRLRANRTIQAFYSRLYAVDGVTSVVVRSGPILLEGDTVPASAFVAVVKGGDDVEVGKAIWLETPFGITPYGNTSVSFVDEYAGIVNVDFYRPVLVPVKVDIVLNVYEGHPSNVDDVVKAAVKAKIDSLAIGENLTIGKLFVALDGIKGIAVSSIAVGKLAYSSMGTVVDLLYYESASVNLSDISVS